MNPNGIIQTGWGGLGMSRIEWENPVVEQWDTGEPVHHTSAQLHEATSEELFCFCYL